MFDVSKIAMFNRAPGMVPDPQEVAFLAPENSRDGRVEKPFQTNPDLYTAVLKKSSELHHHEPKTARKSPTTGFPWDWYIYRSMKWLIFMLNAGKYTIDGSVMGIPHERLLFLAFLP